MSTLILLMGYAAHLILILLIILSIWSVSIMIDRSRAFKIADDSAKIENYKSVWSTTPNAPLKGELASESTSGLLAKIQQILKTHSSSTGALSISTIEYRVRSQLSEERLHLEKNLNTLATLGSNAPFIGLFGTVLGIIEAFGQLASQNNSGSNQIMASLAVALIATATGLLVAIPAVVAYNHFLNRMKKLLTECEVLKDYYLSQIESTRIKTEKAH